VLSDSPRVLCYSHDGCGLGHLRRQLTIAGAVARRAPGTAVLLATGIGEFGPFALPPHVDVLKIPELQKVANGHYVARRLAMQPGDTTDLRAGLLEAAVSHFRPSVLLADKHPLGPAGELVPALEQLSRFGGRAVLGVRDVLDDPAVVDIEWRAAGLAAAFERYYSRALIYGSEHLLDPVTEAGIPPAVLRRASWCGHVVAPFEPAPRPAELEGDGRPVVIACVGGGDDGGQLLRTFVAASRHAPWRAAVVIGPLAPVADRRHVEAAAGEAGVDVYGEVRDLRRWFSHADALVGMGGYNTVVEAAAAACPMVCVPRCRPRREQLIRAHAFADRGLLSVLEPDDLSPDRLAAAVATALAIPRHDVAQRVAATLDLGGAARAAEVIASMGAREPARASA
jgi:predicted glycosyltransferase